MFPHQIFRANDIRGTAETELTSEFAYALGCAFAKRVKSIGERKIMLCRDARLSSPRLHQSITAGILSEQIGIIDIGIGPTPLLAFGLSSLAHTDLAQLPSPVKSGIMITASHNPSNQNGFKITLSGQGFYGDELNSLREEMDLLESNQCPLSIDYSCLSTENRENTISLQLETAYIKKLSRDIDDLSGMRIVIDGANGAAGLLAANTLRALNVDVIEQFCEPDGRFPNRSPDTGNPANLEPLRQRVIDTRAMMGVGFDGDGDRMVAVTATGRLLNADEMIAIFAKSTLKAMPKSAIVFDVKCSPRLAKNILSMDGIPVMSRSGRSFIQTKMKEKNASFAGEYSAHYFFGDRWTGADDGIYAACRLLEICKDSDRSLEDVFSTIPNPSSATVATDEIRLNIPEKDKFEIVENLLKSNDFQINHQMPEIIDIDGLRLEYPSGWVLIRASNTSSTLTLRLEAENHGFMQQLVDKVLSLFAGIAPELCIDKMQLFPD